MRYKKGQGGGFKYWEGVSTKRVWANISGNQGYSLISHDCMCYVRCSLSEVPVVKTLPKPSLQASVHTTNSLLGSAILKIGALVNKFFNFLNLSLHFWFQSNFFPFFCKDVIGLAILEKPSMNLQ